MRTSIENCYERVINRWIEKHNQNNWSYTEEDLHNYSERKKGMYSWYKSLNTFIRKTDEILNKEH